MAYRSPLEARLAKHVTKAITEYGLIEHGDRVMVGLSGGKDSWALLQILDVLRQRAPIDFSLDRRQRRLGLQGLQARRHRRRPAGRAAGSCASSTPRSARSWTTSSTPATRRARSAPACAAASSTGSPTEVGATKIALGHHLDDVVETLLLNTFFAGALKAMPARLVSDDGRHVVIRPMVYVQEADARAYTKEADLPVIGCCCPACGDLSLQRQRVKRLIMDLEREHPHVKASMMKALTNVMPRHLLDRRLAAGPSAPAASAEPEAAFPQLRRAAHVLMRAVVQRVRYARVEVDTRVVGSIGHGLLALVGVERGDGAADVAHVAAKLRELRIFDDDGGPDGRPRMNRSVVDVGGAVLVVSQFTLAADTRRGRAAVVRFGGAARRGAAALRGRRRRPAGVGRRRWPPASSRRPCA